MFRQLSELSITLKETDREPAGSGVFESVFKAGCSATHSDYSLYSGKSAYFHKLAGPDVR